MLDTQGVHAAAVDDYSEMEIVSRHTAYVSDKYAYFSLLNISGTAQGITVQNAKYPLTDAEITCEYPYGISNEPLPGKVAQVTVKTGRLLLVKVWQA
jgi:thiamine pyrophosphokinase